MIHSAGRRARPLTASLAALFLASPAAGAPVGLMGFTPAGAQAERAVEAKFDAGLSATAIGARLRQMSSQPNQVGSPHDRANAEFTLAEFRRWGWDAHIEVFHVLYPTPRAQSLELLGAKPFKANLTEPPVPGDASTAITGGVLPAYVAFGGDGDVTAPLVYVNYGMPADYQTLQRLGVEVKGKIVIARYGGGWRGLKPKLAAEHGAVGCIIYSDPAEDGFAPGEAYPEGAWRPAAGLQRGSVLDVAVQPGDPLTPGYGAVDGAPRISLAESRSVMRIPILPISWGNAQPFLAAMTGPVAPKGWRGALPITYRVGPGPAVAHLQVLSNWNQAPLYDVIAVLRGSDWPDQWIVRGNHRDGWVFGAEDPLSGQTALMEEAKSLGALARSGWRPRRTLVYASWDGEEPGLLGSTEWAETHADELRAKAVAYINSDGNGRGFLFVEASYALQSLVDQAAAGVVDPQTGASVGRRALVALQVRALAADADETIKSRAKRAWTEGAVPVGDLGSGSDYTPFVQHLGIAAINIGFGGEGSSAGVYHSAYDTFDHFQRFGDPGFAYGVTLAETVGRLVLQTADADLLPLRFTPLAVTLSGQIAELKALVVTLRQRAEATNWLLDQKAFALAADPTLPWGAPDREAPVPEVDFTALERAAGRLRESAKSFDSAAAAAATAPAERLEAVNSLLQGAEQTLTDPDGLPGRPWYRHLVYAPGLLTGYASKTLPGVREGIEGRRWSEAADYIARTANALDRMSQTLDKSTALLLK